MNAPLARRAGDTSSDEQGDEAAAKAEPTKAEGRRVDTAPMGKSARRGQNFTVLGEPALTEEREEREQGAPLRKEDLPALFHAVAAGTAGYEGRTEAPKSEDAQYRGPREPGRRADVGREADAVVLRDSVVQQAVTKRTSRHATTVLTGRVLRKRWGSWAIAAGAAFVIVASVMWKATHGKESPAPLAAPSAELDTRSDNAPSSEPAAVAAPSPSQPAPASAHTDAPPAASSPPSPPKPTRAAPPSRSQSPSSPRPAKPLENTNRSAGEIPASDRAFYEKE